MAIAGTVWSGMIRQLRQGARRHQVEMAAAAVLADRDVAGPAPSGHAARAEIEEIPEDRLAPDYTRGEGLSIVGVGGLLARNAVDNNNVRIDPGIGEDFAGAFHRIRLALDDLPPRVDASGGKLVQALEGVAIRVADVLTPKRLPAAGGAVLGPFDRSQGGLATPAMIAQAAVMTGVPAAIIAAIGQVENARTCAALTITLDTFVSRGIDT